MRTETVTHDGRTTTYRAVGDTERADPILLVHGAGQTHRCWATQFERAEETPVVAVDLSGREGSEDVDTGPGMDTIDAYARDVVAVAAETGASVAVGHSMGGATLQWCLVEHDLEPEGAVLLCTAAKFVMGEAVTQWLDSGDFEGAIDFLHDNGMLFHDTDHENVEHSVTAMRAAGFEMLERDLLSCGHFDVRDRLGEIDTPTLAITAEHDMLTPPSFGEYLGENVPGATHAEIADAGHMAMLEQPAAFETLLAEFHESVAGEQ